VLQETYVYRKDLDCLGIAVVGRSEGTTIRWKSAEKDLTRDVVAVGEYRSILILVRRLIQVRALVLSHAACPTSRVNKHASGETSFFKFFDLPQRPADDTLNISDEGIEKLEWDLEFNTQLRDDFKDRVRYLLCFGICEDGILIAMCADCFARWTITRARRTSWRLTLMNERT
jgi:hypothetical protein